MFTNYHGNDVYVPYLTFATDIHFGVFIVPTLWNELQSVVCKLKLMDFKKESCVCGQTRISTRFGGEIRLLVIDIVTKPHQTCLFLFQLLNFTCVHLWNWGKALGYVFFFFLFAKSSSGDV